MPLFDDYASMAHESMLGIYGEPVVFIASDNRFAPVDTFAIVSQKQKDFDDDGFKVINESLAVRVDVRNQDFRIDDFVDYNEKRYRIVEERKDVNVTSKFILQEI